MTSLPSPPRLPPPVRASFARGALAQLGQRADLILPAALFGTILVLIVPVPFFVLDMLLAASIGIALLILLVILYVKDPPDFSGFPTLLLAVTLFRLALNVATTRLILLDGEAGHIIEAFGNFAVRGNYVVGAVVFLILIVINFVVITKGAGRIAEVAARFTLDAMPGKQMAIDAELNAGLIDEDAARRRRSKVQKEADFYGAMDGSSKFVRGDAVAAILITGINVFGGFAIGILQKGLPLVEALRRYTLLSIGDGLVSQIPALIISVAAALLVTRASDDDNVSRQIGGQLTGYPRALGAAAAALGVFAILPGMPMLPFLSLAILAGWGARAAGRGAGRTDARAPAGPPALTRGKVGTTAGKAGAAGEPPGPENFAKLTDLDVLAVELDGSLVSLANPQQGGDLLDRITGVRKSIARDLGVIVPLIAVRDSLQIEPGEYRFLLRGKPVGSSRLTPGRWMAMNVAGSTVELPGTRCVEPVFGLEAVWIASEQRTTAEINGYTVVDPASVLITHLAETLKRHAHLILSRQDTQCLVDHVKATHGALVSELLPDLVTVGVLQRVLQNLLREGISIRNLPLIMEAVADYAPISKHPDDLSEQVRRRLGLYFIGEYESVPGTVRAVTLDPRLEQALVSKVQRTPYEIRLSMDPPLAQHLLADLNRACAQAQALGQTPIVLTTTELRLPFKRFFETSLAKLAVLAYQELPGQTEVQNLATLSFPPAPHGVVTMPLAA